MNAEHRRKAAIHGEKEVERAILDLGPHDKKKLEAASWTLVQRLALDMAYRDHEDLLAQAFARTLSGDRAWKHGVDFVRHLTETMRSIAWTWHERQDAEEQAGRTVPWDDLAVAPDDDTAWELPPEVYSSGRDVETRLIVAEDLGALRNHFDQDAQALQVLFCWEVGLDGPECCSRKGMTEKELRAAIRRIRRHAQRRRAASGATDAN